MDFAMGRETPQFRDTDKGFQAKIYINDFLQRSSIRVPFLAEANDFSLLRSVQTESGAHTPHPPYRGLFPRMYSGRGAELTTHLHLVPKLRTNVLQLHSPMSS
jgi:hypothetical protein